MDTMLLVIALLTPPQSLLARCYNPVDKYQQNLCERHTEKAFITAKYLELYEKNNVLKRRVRTLKRKINTGR